MKKINILLVVFTITFILMSTENVFAKRHCLLSPDEIDLFLDNIEQKLPYLEKEAEIMVKMLNSKKHLAKIKQDIEASCDFTSEPKIRPQDTHFFRALKAFSIKPDSLLTKIHSKKYQLVSQDLHTIIITGGCCYTSDCRFTITKILPEFNKNQLEKISEIMNKIIETLTPVYLIANEKISNEDLYSCRNLRPTGNEFYRAYEVYYILNHSKKFYPPIIHFISKNPTAAKKFFIESKIPDAYIEMLKNYIQYLSIQYNAPKNGWKYYIRFFDNILAERAENNSDIFGDLEGDTSHSDNDTEMNVNNTDSGDLNFNDLKLPE